MFLPHNDYSQISLDHSRGSKLLHPILIFIQILLRDRLVALLDSLQKILQWIKSHK